MAAQKFVPLSSYATRDEAEAHGSKYFYTGVRCKRGHDANRFVSNGGCCACVNRRAAPTMPQATNEFPIKVSLPRGSAIADAVRIQFYVRELLDTGRYARDMAERFPLIPAALPGGQTIESLRELGVSDSLMVEAGYATRGELRLTEKAGALTLESFRVKGWTDAQLVEQGYAEIVTE